MPSRKTSSLSHLLLISFLILLAALLLTGIEKGGGEETLYVDDDAAGGGDGSQDRPFDTIHAALENASDGDTLRVYAGSYRGSILVEKVVSLIGNSSTSTTIDGEEGRDVVEITANWVNLTGFRIRGDSGLGADGIRITADHARVFENNISQNRNGISLVVSDNATIENNSCQDNENSIYFVDSHGNAIENNTFLYSTDNLVLENSGNNTFSFNTCSHHIHGVYLRNSDNNTFLNNTISSNTVGIYLERESDGNTARNNSLFRNEKYAIQVFNNGGYTIDAAYNFWDGLTGPYHATDNPGGNGDSVTDYVIFAPWLRRLTHREETGEIISGKGTVHRMEGTLLELELEKGDFIKSGDTFTAGEDTVILVPDEKLDVVTPGGGLYLFVAKGSRIGVLLDQDDLFVWIGLGFSAFYMEMPEDGAQAQTRAGGGGTIEIALGRNELIDDVFLDEKYEAVVDISGVTNTSFFSLDVEEGSSEITSYTGAVDVKNDTAGSRETVEEYSTLNTATDTVAQDASYELMKVEGDSVSSTVSVDEKRIEEVADAYHIPSFGSTDSSLAILPVVDEYAVDIDGKGSGGYSFSFSQVRERGEKTFQVTTTSSPKTKDSYGVTKFLDLTIESNDLKKSYDIEIVRRAAGVSSSFQALDLEMAEGDQVFSVTDWDNVETTPVNYMVSGRAYSLHTGTTGNEVRILMQKEETNSPQILISIGIFGLILAVFITGESQLQKGLESVGEQVVYRPESHAALRAPPSPPEDEDDGLVEIYVDPDTMQEIDIKTLLLQERSGEEE